MTPSCGAGAVDHGHRIAILRNGEAPRPRLTRVVVTGCDLVVVLLVARLLAGLVLLAIAGGRRCLAAGRFAGSEAAIVEGALILLFKDGIGREGRAKLRAARVGAARRGIEYLGGGRYGLAHERNAENGEAQHEPDDLALASQRRSHEDYSSRERRTYR